MAGGKNFHGNNFFWRPAFIERTHEKGVCNIFITKYSKTMDEKKEKRSYHFNVTEVVDGKIQEVMNFNFGGHHDLAALAQHARQTQNISGKHACELVLGMRLLHHVLKKNAENPQFAAFLEKLNDFKHYLKGK